MPLRSQGRRRNRADERHRPKQKTAEKVSPTVENREQWRHAKMFLSGDSSYKLAAGTVFRVVPNVALHQRPGTSQKNVPQNKKARVASWGEDKDGSDTREKILFVP
jgi:hypothetical protein